MVYAVKLNPVDKPSAGNKLEWLSDYEDIFPKELTQLSPKHEVDHAIDLIPGTRKKTLQDVCAQSYRTQRATHAAS